MKISHDESIINLRNIGNKETQDKTASGKERHKVSIDPDKVQLSARAVDFKRIREELETIPENRRERVAELSKSLNNGTYQVDDEKVAEKLVKDSIIDLLY